MQPFNAVQYDATHNYNGLILSPDGTILNVADSVAKFYATVNTAVTPPTLTAGQVQLQAVGTTPFVTGGRQATGMPFGSSSLLGTMLVSTVIDPLGHIWSSCPSNFDGSGPPANYRILYAVNPTTMHQVVSKTLGPIAGFGTPGTGNVDPTEDLAATLGMATYSGGGNNYLILRASGGTNGQSLYVVNCSDGSFVGRTPITNRISGFGNYNVTNFPLPCVKSDGNVYHLAAANDGVHWGIFRVNVTGTQTSGTFNDWSFFQFADPGTLGTGIAMLINSVTGNLVVMTSQGVFLEINSTTGSILQTVGSSSNKQFSTLNDFRSPAMAAYAVYGRTPSGFMFCGHPTVANTINKISLTDFSVMSSFVLPDDWLGAGYVVNDWKYFSTANCIYLTASNNYPPASSTFALFKLTFAPSVPSVLPTSLNFTNRVFDFSPSGGDQSKVVTVTNASGWTITSDPWLQCVSNFIAGTITVYLWQVEKSLAEAGNGVVRVQQGVFTGTVTVTPTGGSPIAIPVTFNVGYGDMGTVPTH